VEIQDILIDIIKRTKSNEMKWRLVDNSKWDSFIFNSQFTFRKFETSYEPKQREYTLVFSEKKLPDPGDDYGSDRYQPELLIFLGNKLVATMDENNVERDDLMRLINLIDSNNEDLKSLLSELE